MLYKESFPTFFQYNGCLYAARIFVCDAPGFYYYHLFSWGKQLLFFVDDERDEWIEHGLGHTPLADLIGDCIDRHYHPDRFQNNRPIDPE